MKTWQNASPKLQAQPILIRLGVKTRLVKKTTEHLEAEQSWWKNWRRAEDGQEEPGQTKKKVQSQKNHPNITESNKNKDDGCLTPL